VNLGFYIRRKEYKKSNGRKKEGGRGGKMEMWDY